MPDPDIGSPIWWLARLDHQLVNRSGSLFKLNDYYEGRHRLAFTSQKFRQAFGGLFSAFADNWCELIVDAVEERMNVNGFRMGGTDDVGEPTADEDAWRIWQNNQLDAESQIAHTEALIFGVAYALVWADGDGQPLITVESPLETIVEFQPGNRRRRAAGLKRWTDLDRSYATLYLPDGIYKFTAKGGIDAHMVTEPDPRRWERREVPGEPWPLPNPLGEVPLVPLVNRRRLIGGGVSEIANVIPVQDAVNKLVADMLVASEYAAFPQRYVTGLDIQYDEAGNAKAPFQIAIDKLLQSENPESKFGTLEAGDLENYVTAIEMLVQHIASQTRTPPHYLNASADRLSGESIKAAETGLVAKAKRKMRHFGEAWEEVTRLAFAVLDDPRSQITNGETIWADPESRTESEHIDAVVKKASLGVPSAQLWEDAGYSPPQISRFRQMRQQDAIDRIGLDVDAVLE